MARAMWKACVAVGDARVPVKLYAAIEDRAIHFRLLHAPDLAPVRRTMIDPVEDEVVGKDAIQRGLEVEPGVFVVIGDDERRAVAPAASREIVVEQVVPASAVDARWVDRPYYLGPDGDDEGYAALVDALGAGRVAIARWVMRRRRYHGALRGRDGYLLVETLRHRDDVADVSADDAGAEVDPRERAMAEQLVAMLDGPFEPDAYRDEHRARVMALIEAKAEGRVVHLPARPRRAAPDLLADALAASLRGGGEAAGGR